jgi:hypothetical protein
MFLLTHPVIFHIQGDSLGADQELVIIKHAALYRLKRNLASTYIGGYADNWFAILSRVRGSVTNNNGFRIR